MNKQILITLAVIIGLLAFWLLVVVISPEADEPSQGPIVEEIEQQAAVSPAATVTATVQIVESLDDIAEATTVEEDVEAKVTIKE